MRTNCAEMPLIRSIKTEPFFLISIVTGIAKLKNLFYYSPAGN